MSYLPTSCMIFFFLFSLFHPSTCASSKQELGSCETTLFQCGNNTAGFPFWGRNRSKLCGHPLLELRCIKDNTFLFISNQEFNVLQINQTSNTLTLARQDHMGSFCISRFTNTTLPPEIFELSPTYKSLTLFYFCINPYPSLFHACPGVNNIYPDYDATCRESFTVNVPSSFFPDSEVANYDEIKLNMTNFENVLREGFEVKVKIDEKACQECSSSHEFCGFNESLSLGVKCGPLHRPTADELHRRCSAPFSCGDQSDLLYPFWISGREECGQPNFKLECNASFAELNTSSVKFRILEANYDFRIIRLARTEIRHLCPEDPLMVPFNKNVLPLAPGTELLTIYYDCSRDFSQYVSAYVGQLPCDIGRSYYVTRNLLSILLQGMSRFLNDLRGACKSNVSIPASGPALNALQNNWSRDNLKKALQEGFELRYNQDCSICMESRGTCGYNQITRGSSAIVVMGNVKRLTCLVPSPVTFLF